MAGVIVSSSGRWRVRVVVDATDWWYALARNLGSARMSAAKRCCVFRPALYGCGVALLNTTSGKMSCH